MLVNNLLNNVRIDRVLNAVAAGLTAQLSSSVDMQGYTGCMFVASFGTLTATQVTSIKVQQSDDDGATDAYSDLEGSLVGPMADADSNKLLVVDVVRPQKRYLKLSVNRGTANAVIDGVTAYRYGGHLVPPASQGTTVASTSETKTSPSEGTA